MGLGQMVHHGGMPAPHGTPGVTGHPVVLKEDLEGVVRDPNLHLLTTQGVRHGVVMTLHLDMGVDSDACDLPGGQLIRGDGERL